jgi:hypothetical protein
MSTPRPPFALPLKALLVFPLRTRRDLGQLLLTGVLITGLQIAFFPFALILDAGYSMQVARAILFDKADLALPADLDWHTIISDGLRRCGLWLVFLLPGVVLSTLILSVAGVFIWQFGLVEENIPWLYALLGVGLSFALLLCLVGVELANVAAMYTLLTGSFSAAFHFRAWLPIFRARFAAFELVELAAFLAGLVLVFITLAVLLPAAFICIGPPVLFVTGSLYLHLVSTAATAFIYRDAIIYSKQIAL